MQQTVQQRTTNMLQVIIDASHFNSRVIVTD